MANHVNMQSEYATNYVQRRVAKGDRFLKTVEVAARLFRVSPGCVQVKYYARKRGHFPRYMKAKLYTK